MSLRKAISFNDPLPETIATLAEDNSLATTVLEGLLQRGTGLNSILDLLDMNLRGDQIAFAHAFAGNDLKNLQEALASRSGELVAYVNHNCPKADDNHLARTHGAQKRISQVDFAVESALKAQKMGAVAGRMDEGSIHIHNFFLALLQSMQASGSFISNMTVNLGLESGHSARFAIQLVEVLDKEGNPYRAQPQEEAARIAAAQTEPSSHADNDAGNLDSKSISRKGDAPRSDETLGVPRDPPGDRDAGEGVSGEAGAGD